VLSALETVVIITLYKSTFTIPYLAAMGPTSKADGRKGGKAGEGTEKGRGGNFPKVKVGRIDSAWRGAEDAEQREYGQ